MNILLLLTALLRLAPFVMKLINEGKIKKATEEEVLRVVELEFFLRLDGRLEDVRKARASVTADNDGNVVPDKLDPNDRANQNDGKARKRDGKKSV